MYEHFHENVTILHDSYLLRPKKSLTYTTTLPILILWKWATITWWMLIYLFEYGFKIDDDRIRHYLPYECLRVIRGFVVWKAASLLRTKESVTVSVAWSFGSWFAISFGLFCGSSFVVSIEVSWFASWTLCSSCEEVASSEEKNSQRCNKKTKNSKQNTSRVINLLIKWLPKKEI